MAQSFETLYPWAVVEFPFDTAPRKKIFRACEEGSAAFDENGIRLLPGDEFTTVRLLPLRMVDSTNGQPFSLVYCPGPQS
jgi:hypothetical protein